MVEMMKRQYQDVSDMVRNRSRSFADGFVTGLASMLTLHTPKRQPRYRRIDANTALRGDMQRIGDDMRRVIERERGHEKAGSKAFGRSE